MAMEYVSCNLCGSEEYRVLFKPDESQKSLEKISITDIDFSSFGQVVRCRSCGLIYKTPREPEEYFAKLYGTAVEEKYLEEEAGRSASFSRGLNVIESIHGRKGKLLEIGCSVGLLLNLAKRRGWEVCGIEPSSWAAEYASNKFGIDIKCGIFDNTDFDANCFDAVVFIDVLEHLFDPCAALLEANRILNKNGVVYIVTPNINSLVPKVLGRKWWSLVAVHNYYFSPKTIDALLKKAGFIPQHVRSYGRHFSLGYLGDRAEAAFTWGFVNLLSKSLLRNRWLSNRVVYFNLGDQMEIAARKK
jgi:SAM-dependent methyltransferase